MVSTVRAGLGHASAVEGGIALPIEAFNDAADTAAEKFTG